jgi:hypothetical protein
MADDKLTAVPTTDAALACPSYITRGDRAGTEHITKEDVVFPRLALAQSTSPQLKDSESCFIESLRPGHLFNTLTGENYGKGPLEFIIVRADRPRYMELTPYDEGGGIKDPNVPPDDPRTQWGADGSKPVASKFYDYIILLLPLGDDPRSRLIALSMTSTQIKVARRLNGFIQMRGTALYTGKYRITSMDDKGGGYTWKNFDVKNAGWCSEAELQLAQNLYESLKDQTIVIDHSTDHDASEGAEPEGGGDASFDTAQM